MRKPSIGVHDVDRVAARLQEELEELQLLLDALAFGDIADDADRAPVAPESSCGHGKLDGEAATVLVHRLQFEQLSNRFPLASPEEMGPRFLVELAIVRGCQKLVQVAAQDLLTRVAEHPLRGRVPVPDLARRVHQDQCVERGVADDSQRLLSGPQFLFVALAVADFPRVDDDSADLVLLIQERTPHPFKPEVSAVGMTEP